MNRIWLAAGLTAAMIVLCAVLLGSTARMNAEMNSGIDELRAAEPESSAAQEAIEQLSDRWERYEKTLSIHVRHSDIEEVTYALSKIESCWQLGEYELFIMACDEAKVALEHLWEESRPTLKNVL